LIVSEKEFQRRLLATSALTRAGEPVAIKRFDTKALDGVPIFAADDVGLYISSLPIDTDMTDVVAGMAPPFDKFFIEFQGVPNGMDMSAWGALIETIDDPDEMLSAEGAEEKPRWELRLDTFLEREKGKPFGPAARHYAGLAEDGTWFRHANGALWWAGGPVELSKKPPDEAMQSFGNSIGQLLFPVLLTISFLHCKNVKIKAKKPPKKLSRKHYKKRGRDLVRYHVLDVEPIRRVIEQYRTGSREDLRRALHICRGHFKTFTDTYYWAPQVRGSKDSGVVLKDYRVHAPSELGRSYRDADENPPDATKEAPPSKNPDSVGRGLAAHNKTQNMIADIVSKLGWHPRSPKPGEPEFDVAWKAGDNLFVCEVKSLTPTNEERQLRMGLGQVIRYKQKLAAAGHEPVTAVIAAEREPEDPSWDELCKQENILLVWPENAERRFNEEMKIIESAKV
jgi:hypothetical protein